MLLFRVLLGDVNDVARTWPHRCSTRLRPAIERIASIRVAAVETSGEPLLSLGGRSMSPRVRVHGSAGCTSEEVVADDLRRVEGVLDVTWLEQVPGVRTVCPDSGQAIGLELESYPEGILGRRGGRLGGSSAAADSD